MRVGICSVGTELLTGDQVDSNATWLAGRLSELGATPALTLTVRDDLDEMVDVLRVLLDRCDALVVGGGLGPTPDDLTREAIARAADVELAPDVDMEAAIRDRFTALGATMSDNNLRQARLPAGAQGWPPVGTAPGFVVEIDGVPVWALPGVPWELQQLFDEHVAPDVLERTGGQATITRVVHVTSMGESQVSEAMADVEARAAEAGVHVAYLATRSEIQVKLTVTGEDRDHAWASAQDWVDEAVEALGSAVAGTDANAIEQVVHDLLLSAGATVAAAESATAGMLCSALAEVPGSSATFRGGAVVYATGTKADVVGVDPDLLDEHPAVSQEVTSALARQVRRLYDADYGVATTGVAGPAPQEGVEVGTCIWAVCGPDDHVDVMERNFPGDRATRKGRLTTAAMEMLRRRLLADRDDRVDAGNEAGATG